MLTRGFNTGSSIERRDSYVSNKSVSVEPNPPSPIYLLPPARSRCISMTDTCERNFESSVLFAYNTFFTLLTVNWYTRKLK